MTGSGSNRGIPRSLLIAGLATLLALLPAQLRAQGTASVQDPPEADPADVSSIDAIMASLYDVISGPAGEPRDWDRMRSLFMAEARLIPTFVTPEGEIGYRANTLSEWIQGADEYFQQNAFWESEISRVTERFGNIAHAFSSYESLNAPDAEPFARGINSVQLMWDGDRWWIVTVFWDSERPDNPIPDKYLGGRR